MPRGIRAAALALATLVTGCGATAGAPERTAPPSDPRVPVPIAVQRDVHAMLHRLSRVCGRRRADTEALERTTRAFTRYYRRYPSRRFRLQIDDESGTMLSAILVLRAALARCSPGRAREVDKLLPARIRRALRPLD